MLRVCYRYSTKAEESVNAARYQIWRAEYARSPNKHRMPSPRGDLTVSSIMVARCEKFTPAVVVYAGRAMPPPLEGAPTSLGGGGGASSLVLSAIMRLKPIETPSMTASKMAQDMAPLRIDL